MSRRASTKRMRHQPDERESVASSADEDDREEIALDSDEEIQLAHAAGKLEGGIHVVADDERQHINNRAALESKLNAIKLNLPWVERLDSINQPAVLAPEFAQAYGINAAVVSKGKPNDSNSTARSAVPQTAREVRAQDDFERELFFYRQAQAMVLESIPRLKQLGVPTKRPDDYFAEMVKTDEHMQKIRKVLLLKQQEAESSEKARRLREQKKRGAQVHFELQQDRAREKRDMLKSVKNYRETGGKSSTMDDLLGDDDTNKIGKQNRYKDGGKRRTTTDRREPNAKRQGKNEQFGYGGKMRGSKRNTRESTDAYPSSSRSFSRSSFSTPQQVKRTRQKIQKQGGGKQKRPGKTTRQSMKNRR